jgi:hypothetical protein
MIGHQMSRHGPRSRAFTPVYVAGAVVVAAFCAALMVIPSEDVEKIGPGYAHMQPIDYGKAEKVAYSVPYTKPVYSHSPKAKPVPVIADPILAEFVGASSPVIVAAVPLSYSPDIHRIY